MYTDRPIHGEPVDTGVDSTRPAAPSATRASGPAGHPSARTDRPGRRGYLDPGSTTERLRLLWATGARDVTLVAPRDTPRPRSIDPRGWIA